MADKSKTKNPNPEKGKQPKAKEKEVKRLEDNSDVKNVEEEKKTRSGSSHSHSNSHQNEILEAIKNIQQTLNAQDGALKSVSERLYNIENYEYYEENPDESSGSGLCQMEMPLQAQVVRPDEKHRRSRFRL